MCTTVCVVLPHGRLNTAVSASLCVLCGEKGRYHCR
jgi:hypothetical protein